MAIRLIAIGKDHENWVSEGIGRYQKRLKRQFMVDWVLLPHSALDGNTARRDESQRILSRISISDFVILLDENGKNINSPALAKVLDEQISHSRQIIIIIGGAYGVDNTVHQRADFIWSLSNLVFPHQLVRLILTEQLYRAQEISSGRPYHHE